MQTGSGAGAQLSVESELLCLKREAVTLEQEVTRLFELLRDSVYRYLMASFGNAAEAEEITQESFLRLYRYLHSGRTVGNVGSWIFRVAHNLAIDQHRHSKYIEPIDSASWDELCRTRPDAGPNPEQRAIRKEQFDGFQAALGRLSPQERQCLNLRAEGFRYREIAGILGIRTSTVAESLRRGIHKLMKGPYG